jgi:hypothetical protein
VNGLEIGSIHVASAASTPDSTLDLTATPWVTETANNFTASVTGLSTLTVESDFQFVADYHGLSAYDSDYPDITSGAASSVFTASAADTGFVNLSLYRNGNWGNQSSLKRGASPLALTAPTLPWLGALVATGSQAVWLQTSGAAFDAEILRFDWRTSVLAHGGSGGNNTTYWHWNIILPPSTTSFAFPTPPPQLAAYLPSDSTDIDNISLQFVDLSSAADYDAVRALPEYRVTDLYNAVRSGDEPSGTASSAENNRVSLARMADRFSKRLGLSALRTKLLSSDLPGSRH